MCNRITHNLCYKWIFWGLFFIDFNFRTFFCKCLLYLFHTQTWFPITLPSVRWLWGWVLFFTWVSFFFLQAHPMLVGKQQLFSDCFCYWREKDQLCKADAVDFFMLSAVKTTSWGWWINSGYVSAAGAVFGISILFGCNTDVFPFKWVLPLLSLPMEDKHFVRARESSKDRYKLEAVLLMA